MATIKKISEQRSHKRFRVQEGSIAVIHDRDHIIGPVIDISQNGLALRYVKREKKTSCSPKLSLFLTAQAFRLQKIPFEIIYDFEEKPQKPVNSLTIHRCGGQFGKLSKEEKFTLRSFIKNYAKIDS